MSFWHQLYSNLFCLLADFARLGLLVIGIGLFIVIISFLKSLQTRFNFVHTTSYPQSLTKDDVHFVYRKLSWSHSQIDSESVNWINQTVKTLWPSIKTVVRKLVLDELLKPDKFVFADKLRKTYNKFKTKQITLERVRFGDSTPTINGVKYIDENSEFLLDTNRVSQHLAPNFSNNMRFMCEVAYKSDRKFHILVNSLPVLNRIDLTQFSFQVRFLITVNHTTTELNRDLEVLETPGDVLFPAINYAQLTLVDVPSIDWRLQRPKASSKPQENPSSNQKLSGLYSKILFYLDPINLINHDYFKYIIHSTLYVVLKWFQPIDFKVGPQLYIKTIC